MKYKIEFIHKQTTYEDIIENWAALNKRQSDESPHGFYFMCDTRPMVISGGVMMIDIGESQYYYNISDFYRIKVSELS